MHYSTIVSIPQVTNNLYGRNSVGDIISNNHHHRIRPRKEKKKNLILGLFIWNSQTGAHYNVTYVTLPIYHLSM